MRVALQKEKGEGFAAWLIDMASGGAGYFHSVLLLGDGTGLTSLPTTGLTRIIPAEYPAQHWDIWDIGGDADADARAIEWYEASKGGGYDFCGAVRSVFGDIPQNPRDYYCSEANVECAQWALGIWTRVDPSRTSPDDLCLLLTKYPRV